MKHGGCLVVEMATIKETMTSLLENSKGLYLASRQHLLGKLGRPENKEHVLFIKTDGSWCRELLHGIKMYSFRSGS